jgi:hypothetical protein
VARTGLTIEDIADDYAAVDRFLLLLPAFGDVDTPAAVHRLITRVVATVGAVRGQPILAAQLLDNRRYWVPSPWTTVDGVLVWECPAADGMGGEVFARVLYVFGRVRHGAGGSRRRDATC